MIRFFGYYFSKTYLYLAVVEAAVFFVALNVGGRVRLGWAFTEELEDANLFAVGLLFAAFMTTAMVAMGLYQRGVQGLGAGFLVRVGVSFLLGTVLFTVALYAVPSMFIGRGVVALSLGFSFLGIVASRVIFTRISSADSRKRRVLVLGAGANAQRIDELQESVGGAGFLVAGYVLLPGSRQLVPQGKLIELNGPLVELVIARDVDEIVVAADDRRGKIPVEDLLDCKMSGFEVLDLLTFFEKELAIVKIDLLHPSWIFFSPGFRMGVTGLYGKRLLDLAAGILMLSVAAPIMTLVALASLIESRGRDPIFFHQVRVGQEGKLFRLHKFRSMRVDAEADGVARWASKGDARITRLGAFLRKTRLDELPQILNVLKGEMSLVGPRPERPEFVDKLSANIPYYSQRHRVKPGVTGWAQLLYPYGSGENDAKRKLEFDLYYVKNAGVMLDMVILLQTVEVVVFGKGAR